MNIVKSCLLGALVVALSACGHPIMLNNTSKLISTDHVVDKNYMISEAGYARIGDSVIKVKDYYVSKFQSNIVTPTSNAVVSGGLVELTISSDSEYKVIGSTTMDGIAFRLVEVGDRLLLIDSQGKIYHRIFVGFYGGVRPGAQGQMSLTPVAYSMSVVPENVRMRFQTKEAVEEGQGYTNYEIIYNGVGGGSMLLTYKEFTPDDLARPAFFQNLSYPEGSKFIRFRDHRIEVLKADSEGIKYRVLEE